jgi:hypothetical protein
MLESMKSGSIRGPLERGWRSRLLPRGPPTVRLRNGPRLSLITLASFEFYALACILLAGRQKNVTTGSYPRWLTCDIYLTEFACAVFTLP